MTNHETEARGLIRNELLQGGHTTEHAEFIAGTHYAPITLVARLIAELSALRTKGEYWQRQSQLASDELSALRALAGEAATALETASADGYGDPDPGYADLVSHLRATGGEG